MVKHKHRYVVTFTIDTMKYYGDVPRELGNKVEKLISKLGKVWSIEVREVY